MDDAFENLTRRGFIATGLTTGFALAVSPVTAFALTTSEEGLHTEMVQIPTGGKKMPGYLAEPKEKGLYPVVLVIQEIFGVHAYIQDVCRRFAKEGYIAVAPSLYFREGDVTKLKSIDEIRPIVAQVPQTQVWSDLDATVEWMKQNKKANVSRLAVTGFCWGGNVTWMYAAHNPKVRAGVAWYGRLVGDKTPLQSQFPVDVAAELKVPVLGLYGAKDKGIPLDSIEKMRAELKRGKSKSEIHVYPEAEHGFHADYRPSFHEASAKDGWTRLLAHFRKHV